MPGFRRKTARSGLSGNGAGEFRLTAGDGTGADAGECAAEVQRAAVQHKAVFLCAARSFDAYRQAVCRGEGAVRERCGVILGISAGMDARDVPSGVKIRRRDTDVIALGRLS